MRLSRAWQGVQQFVHPSVIVRSRSPVRLLALHQGHVLLCTCHCFAVGNQRMCKQQVLVTQLVAMLNQPSSLRTREQIAGCCVSLVDLMQRRRNPSPVSYASRVNARSISQVFVFRRHGFHESAVNLASRACFGNRSVPRFFVCTFALVACVPVSALSRKHLQYLITEASTFLSVPRRRVNVCVMSCAR